MHQDRLRLGVHLRKDQGLAQGVLGHVGCAHGVLLAGRKGGGVGGASSPGSAERCTTGARADFIELTDTIEVKRIWVDGAEI